MSHRSIYPFARHDGVAITRRNFGAHSGLVSLLLEPFSPISVSERKQEIPSEGENAMMVELYCPHCSSSFVAEPETPALGAAQSSNIPATEETARATDTAQLIENAENDA